jgi:hypothetical protein
MTPNQREASLFALLQVVHVYNAAKHDDDATFVKDVEYVEVVKVDASKRLEAYAADYSRRFHAAADHLDDAMTALEDAWGEMPSNEHGELHDKFCDKYGVSGALIPDIEFHIVEVLDGGDDRDDADDAPTPLVSGAA